jgi:hypothetical protein
MTEDGKVCWQGEFIDREGDDHIAQLYEWFGGSPSNIERMTSEDIFGKHPDGSPKTRIYDSPKERNDWYEKHGQE